MTTSTRKIVLALSLVPALALTIAHRASASCVDPAPNEITVHQHASFGGSCYRIINLPTEGVNYGDARFWFPNDTISSLKVGVGMNLRVFQHVNGGGNSRDFAGGDAPQSLGSWNDMISSMKAI